MLMLLAVLSLSQAPVIPPEIPPEVAQVAKDLDAIAIASRSKGGANSAKFVEQMLTAAPRGQETALERLARIKEGVLCGWVEGLLIVAEGLGPAVFALAAQSRSYQFLADDHALAVFRLRHLQRGRCGGPGGKAGLEEWRVLGMKLMGAVRGPLHRQWESDRLRWLQPGTPGVLCSGQAGICAQAPGGVLPQPYVVLAFFAAAALAVTPWPDEVAGAPALVALLSR
jgi:hypothetical protein